MLRIAAAMQGENRSAPRRERTKTSRIRFVEADPELREWIAQHRADAIGAAPLFVDQDGQRWTGSTLRDTWNTARRSTGIDVKMYEGTKHSSASAAVRRGVRIEEIQAALGHRDARSTALYAKLCTVAPASILRPRP